MKVHLRNVIFAALIFCVCSVAYAGNQLVLAERGKSFAVIVVDVKSSDRTKTAANTLSYYLNLSTGATFSISNLVSQNTSSAIQIRLGVKRSSIIGDVKNLDGFTICASDTKTITITGESDWGTEFGVYDFLEKFVGIRWLFPGHLGEHVPYHDKLIIPVSTVRDYPRFFMRLLSGLVGTDEFQWAYRNRMHDPGIRFHHNLFNLFPPATYATTHPEFFPVINGQRFIPAAGVESGWQPCFTASGLVDEAVKNIIDYFDKNPSQKSFSLGVNDSDGYCQCDRCLARVAGKKNSIWKPDYSELYYSWANAVIEGVSKKYPDKLFGCLAYDYVQDPPTSFSLNSHLIPFITYERLQWADPNLEQKGKYFNGLWEQKATILGWYDYIYGNKYLLPRVYPKEMASYIHYGAAHRAQVIYSEAYPNWGEGPKLYLALRLQWNPNLDVTAAFVDWCISAVGSDAAPALEAYFNFWEDFWTKRIIGTPWFVSVPSMYLPFYRNEYVNYVTQQELDNCRYLLETVQLKALTTEQKNRATYFLQTFQNYVTGIQPYRSKSISAYLNPKSLFTELDPGLLTPAEFKLQELSKIGQNL